MQKVLNLYKPVGSTPLETIEKFRLEHPEYTDVKLGYAGRLDPMAEGVLLVLVGEENKKRKIYEDLPKEYEFEVLFGVRTDTYDVLGLLCHCEHIRQLTVKQSGSGRRQVLEVRRKNPMPQPPSSILMELPRRSSPLVKQASSSVSRVPLPRNDILEKIQQLIPGFIGKHLQPYPPYSSQPVKGKPLFYWARENKLSEITIPKKEIEIYDLELTSSYDVTPEELEKIILEKLEKVHGNFRQKEIKESWRELLAWRLEDGVRSIPFSVLRFRIVCSSGTYVRSIAHDMGEKMGCGAIALSIKRTRVGDFST